MAKNDTPEIPGLFDDLPEEAPQEQIAKISLRSWRTHLTSIRTLDKRIEKLIDEAVKQALAQGRKLTSADIGRVFQRHPELRTALDKTMQQLNDDLTATIEQGSKDAWLRANTAADAVVAAMANNNAQLAALLNAGTNKPQNDRALRAFQQREMQGLKLSDRVWRATEGMKLDMERAIEVALAEGVPAQKLSERVRELLKEPHRLYRRVRDKDGNLRLSQAAQKYHPGTGVYRSSYKNAMRVARTEVNMAYQASDSERWTRSWWVKGIRVSLSNNHTSPDSKGRPAALVDICDELAGDYPADFKFTGWHPQCRCFATAITCEYTDIRDYYRRKRAGEDMTGYTPPGTITEPPEQFKRWMADNSDRLAGAAQRGTTPYFIANNAKYTDPNWKPSKTTASADPMPAPRPKTPLEIADERHARRTAEEAEKIQKAWEERKRQIAELRNNAQSVNGELNKYVLDDADGLALRKIYQDAIAGNDLNAMRRNMAAAKEYLQKQAETRAWLGDTIPDIDKWNEKLTLSQLAEVRADVKIKMQGWSKKTPEQRQTLINKELGKIMKDKDNPLRDIASAAWQQQYHQQSLLVAKNQLSGLEAFAAKHADNKQIQEKLAKLKEAIDKGDGQAAGMHTNGLNYIKTQLEKPKKTAAPTSTPKAKPTSKAAKATALPDWAVSPKTGQPYRWATEEQIEKTMTECRCTREEALRMNRSVRNFSSGWDWDIRHYQQGCAASDLGHDIKEVKERAEDLEKFLHAAPQWDGGTTYRGIAVDPTTLSRFKRRAKDGKAIDMLGSSSWSTERSTSMEFALDNAEVIDDASMCLFRCEGKQKGTTIRHLSAYEGEEEVLCSQDARWRIKSATRIAKKGVKNELYDVWEFVVELIE
nr:MAG TPA: minor capsid protein [Caudoviricetes sp.]